MHKKLLVLLAKYGLGLGLLAWVIAAYWHIYTPEPDSEDVGLAGVFVRSVHWQFLILACAFELASVLLTFVRWFVLVRAQGLPFSLPSALRLGMIGFYLNTFLPGAVGGDIIKAAFIAREQSRRTVAVATVIIDRVIGLCGLFWLTALAGGFFWLTGLLSDIASQRESTLILESILVVAAGLAAGSVVFWVLLGCLSHDRADALTRWLKKLPKVGGPVGELWRAGWLYRCRGSAVALALVMAMIGHLGFVLVFYFAARTLNDAAMIPSLQAHFLAVPVGMTISAGIPTPGNVGGGEFVYGKLYELLGFAVADGVLASLMKRCIDWALGLAGYLIYLRMKPGLRAAATEMSESQDMVIPQEHARFCEPRALSGEQLPIQL